MEKSIEFSFSAQEELEAHVVYYEQLVAGLGNRFRKCIYSHLSTVQRIPYMKVRYDEVRCVPILGFPYMLHYSVLAERNVIRVHGLIHTSRNPADNWNKQDWIVSEEMPLYGVHAYDLEYYYAA